MAELRPVVRPRPLPGLLRLVSARRRRLPALLARRVDPRRWGGGGRAASFAAARLERAAALGGVWRRLGLEHAFAPEPAEPVAPRRAAPARAAEPRLGLPPAAPLALLLRLEPRAPRTAPPAETVHVPGPTVVLREEGPATAAPPAAASLPVPPPVAPQPATPPPPGPFVRFVERLVRLPGRTRVERVPAPGVLRRRETTRPPAGPRARLGRAPAPLPEPVHRLEPSVGSPLPLRLRRVLERRLGLDLAPVRIHTDTAAARAAQALRAAAFTVERHVYFAEGRFEPRAPEGFALLTHELAHVGQQPPGRAFEPRELTSAQELALELQARGSAAPPPRAGAPQRALVVQPGRGAQSVVALRAPEDEAIASSAAASAPAPAPGPGGADVHEVAEEVLRLLDRRHRLDRERTGVQQWH